MDPEAGSQPEGGAPKPLPPEAAPSAIPSSSQNHEARFSTARRVLAGALLLAWVVLTWVSYQTPYLQACRDQVARVGNAPLIKSCEPLSLTDAPLLVMVVVAGLLLLPDLSSIEIPGVVRLERRVEEQARRQDDIIKMIQHLDISQRQNLNLILLQGENRAAAQGAEVTRLAFGLSEKIKEFSDLDTS